MRQLPSFSPQKTWSQAPGNFTPVEYGSVFPPIRKLADGRLIIDQCRMPDGSWEVAVFDNADHPNLALLPADVPRIVRAVFRRDWQLRCLRSTDAGPLLQEMSAVYRAWDAYCLRSPA